jgi:predicted metal-binding membrane protein
MLAGFTSNAWKRDRLIALAGLTAISALAWVYTIHLAAGMMGMSTMEKMSMPAMRTWNGEDTLLTFVMWTVMMAAMMIPSATPMVLTFVGVKRQRQPDQPSIPATMTFLLGYLVAWVVFSAVATLVQWKLHTAALLSPAMVSTSPLFSGVLLILTGLYQYTPLKNRCLSSCRTPLGFLMTEWREGTTGALSMGLRHGLYCVGCCSFLMALLFVAGVMSLLWSALIAAVVLLEKIIPGGAWFPRLVGLLAIGWGVLFLIHFFGV